MTPVPMTGQVIQLTPLWEHVVRTKQFPSTVDIHTVFIEISERLRDPEWEVRQHALRVLVDVLPTLDASVIDKLLLPVVPELVSNLGHPAPAVRKGALDTLRVYLFYSQDKDMFKKILQEGLNRPDALDNFQTNVTMGIILSVPSLLFPSASSPRPSSDILKEAVTSLAARLIQVTHQEAALKSLVKIREAIGPEEFDSCLQDCDAKVKRDFEVLCEVYNLNLRPELNQKTCEDEEKNLKCKDTMSVSQAWESESDSSGIAEEDAEVLVASASPSRLVLETEIKFNKETAITMTILEEKDEEESNYADDSNDESELEVENNSKVIKLFDGDFADRRRTPRRVHFGGEVVKLRTPDSDDSGLAKPEEPKTRIPVPIYPATRMPLRRSRPYSQPSSPKPGRHRARRISRSQPSSPRREVYTYNAELNPKKSILSRTNSPVFIIRQIETRRVRRNKSSSSRKGFEPPLTVESSKKERSRALSSDCDNNSKDNATKSFEICSKSAVESKRGEGDELSESAESLRNVVSSSSKEIGEDEESKGTLEGESDILEQGSRAQSHQGGFEVGEEQRVIGQSSTKAIEVEAFEREPRSESSRSRSAERKNKSKEHSPKHSLRPSSKTSFETFPKQERNYILMELSSPVRRDAEKWRSDLEEASTTARPSPDSILYDEKKGHLEKIFVPEENLEGVSRKSDFLFGDAVDKARPPLGNIKEPPTSANRTIDSLSTASNEPVSEKTTTSAQAVDTPTERAGTSNLKREFKGISRSVIAEKSVENSTAATASDNNAVVKSGLESGKEETLQGFGRNDADRETVKTYLDGSESLTCSSSEGEDRKRELNWEELGIVSQEVLNDLHNKDDWRARVRGLERTASALRTSSTLVAIESRLGSLLRAVLGGERSCRVAAAGLEVAKVAVAGVSEEALKRRLPELAWGLARQGGPNAAQLARIAMLRLRPALLLEQFLQLHCIGARNAKTRENTLQLLIFSLVTFPSTEFKGELIANKVATMLTDRRRRVRQAALDTLAVLAQIYEPEEVLQAGERATKGQADSESIMAAIRARLARKSLPLVSADGLVVYGLQISPTVQIATGADVDWIVAGSGSVSPGSGRTRGQIIATTAKLDNEQVLRSTTAKRGGGDSLTDGHNFVAIGVGLRSMDRQPMAWQLISLPNQDDRSSQEQTWDSGSRDTDTEKTVEKKLSKNSITSRRSRESVEVEIQGSGELLANGLRESEQTPEQHVHGQINGEKISESSQPRQEGASTKAESRIPVLNSRDRISNTKEMSNEGTIRRGVRNEIIENNGNIQSASKKMPENIRSNNYEFNSRQEDTGYGSMYRRRKRLVQEQAFQALQSPRASNDSFDPNYGSHYQFNKKIAGHPGREFTSGFNALQPNTQEMVRDQILSAITPEDNQKADNNRLSRDSYTKIRRSRSRSEECRESSAKFSTNPQRSLPTRETYGTKYQRQKRMIEENSLNTLKTGSNTLNHHFTGIQNSIRRPTENTDRDTSKTSFADLQGNVSSLDLSKGKYIAKENNVGSEGQRSRSRSKLYHRDKPNRTISRSSKISSTHNTDKRNAEEEEYNEINIRRSSLHANQVYQAQNLDGVNSQNQGWDYTRSSSASSSTSILSVDDNPRNSKESFREQRFDSAKRNVNNNSHSSSAQSQRVEKAFSVVTQRTNLNDDTTDSYNILTSNEKLDEPVESVSLNNEGDVDKGLSIDDELRSTERTERQSNQDEISHDVENIDDSDDTSEELVERNVAQRESCQSILSNESILNRLSKLSNESLFSNHSSKEFNDVRSIVSSKKTSSKVSGSLCSEKSIDNKSNSSRDSKATPEFINNNLSERSFETFEQKKSEEIGVNDEERILSSVLLDEKNSFDFLNAQQSYKESNVSDSTSVLKTSRLHSKEVIEFAEAMTIVDSNESLHISDSIHTPLKRSSSKNSAEKASSPKETTSNVLTPRSTDLVISNNNESNGNEPNISDNITKVETRSPTPTEVTERSKKIPSRMSRTKQKPRINSIRESLASSPQKVEGPLEKPKLAAQQCFAQLENKDWEVTIKGLKALSQIAQYHPEHLEICSPGTIGRLLGNHIRNLRSQVSRAACLAASNIFSFQIRGIEQELDDIVGSLLHRTADTNRFLRADSNTALDCMTEHLPPHRTISIIIQRGATHQNAIVRAAAARLLSKIVDRVGPDYVMNHLPREIRDKLFGTGAKLLIDGNLDARNHAKKMFRRLTRYDGFRKVLTDSVPETTLRHIDKTLRSL